MQKVHFRLNCVAEKRLCLSSLLSPELDWGGVGGGGGPIQARALGQDMIYWQFSDISEKIQNNSGRKFFPFLLTGL